MDRWLFSEALESLIGTIRDGQNQGPVPKVGARVPVGDTGEVIQFEEKGVKTMQALQMQILECVKALKGTQPMFWAKLPTSLVYEVAKQIDGATVMSPDLLYCPEAWCWFEEPLTWQNPDGNRAEQTALSWTWSLYEDREGLLVIGWLKGPPRLRNLPHWIAFVENGQPLSAATHMNPEHDDNVRLLQFTVAAGAFLRTKLAATERRPPERHARKRIAQEAWTGASLIEVVMLRQKETSRESSHRFVEWQHQWVVRAHTRQQWYPSKEKHLPIIVAPYLKGPEGKPLKSPSQSIFAVTR